MILVSKNKKHKHVQCDNCGVLACVYRGRWHCGWCDKEGTA
jgi:ribosomal protein S27AE